MKVIRKPTITDALLFDGTEESAHAICDKWFKNAFMMADGEGVFVGKLLIRTNSGELFVEKDHYLVQAMDGSIYPIDKKEFEELYQGIEVDDGEPIVHEIK